MSIKIFSLRYSLGGWIKKVCELISYKKDWRPRRDLNPCRKRERLVSWTWLDDGDACIKLWWAVLGSNQRLSA